MSYRAPELIVGVLMGTWDDEVRESHYRVGGGLLAVADAIGVLIQIADPDADISIYVDTQNWLRDRACLFAPPGEPATGYPEQENGAQVINLDAYREWRRMRQA